MPQQAETTVVKHSLTSCVFTSSFPCLQVPTLCLDSIVRPFRVKSVCMFRCNGQNDNFLLPVTAVMEQVSCLSGQDSNSQSFDHQSGTLTSSYPDPTSLMEKDQKQSKFWSEANSKTRRDGWAIAIPLPPPPTHTHTHSLSHPRCRSDAETKHFPLVLNIYMYPTLNPQLWVWVFNFKCLCTGSLLGTRLCNERANHVQNRPGFAEEPRTGSCSVTCQNSLTF